MTTEAEARDAYLVVEIPLPNGKLIRGKPLPLGIAKKMLIWDEEFSNGADPSKSLMPMLNAFEEHTGITEQACLELCPGFGLGELIDLVRRFFFWRRTVATATPSPQSQPPLATTPAPGP